MTSTPIPNATLEKRVTMFTYQRNLADDGGMINFSITEYIASGGVPTGNTVGTISGMYQTHPETDAPACPGAAMAALNLPALTNPVSGNDLSKITQGDMVVLVERLCELLAIQQGLM